MTQKTLRIVLITACMVAALSACSATRMETPGQGPRSAPPTATAANQGFQELDVKSLATMLQHKDFTLVNVHVPYEGEIANTDAFVPYDQIATNLAKLPSDKSARIVLYCRSGRMSDIAAQTLVKLGYKNVSSLQGGMVAWEQAGNTVLQKATQ